MVVHMNQTLELIFGWEKKEIWKCDLLKNCIHISEIDVRLLNFSISDLCRPSYGLFTLNSLMGERLARRGQSIVVNL